MPHSLNGAYLAGLRSPAPSALEQFVEGQATADLQTAARLLAELGEDQRKCA